MMIMMGATFMSVAGMIAAWNLWGASWPAVKVSMALLVMGVALLVAGMM